MKMKAVMRSKANNYLRVNPGFFVITLHDDALEEKLEKPDNILLF